MKRIALIYLFSIILLNTVSAQPIVFDWTKAAGGKSSYEGTVGMAKDGAGNIYISSEFSGTRDFGCTILVSPGFSSIYVAKYSPAGNCLWAVLGGANFSSANAGKLAVSGSFVYVTGKFSNILAIGSATVSSTGNTDIFIASLNIADGSCNWIKKAGGTAADVGVGITAATGGGVYVCGNFTSTATFDGFTVSSSSIIDDDIFYAKYNSSGNCLWVKRIGSPAGFDYANAIKEMAGGNILMTGSYEGSVQFGTGPTLTSVGFADIYILIANSNGDVLAARSGGGTNNDVGNDIDTDPSGNIYMTGLIYSSAVFGSVAINTNNNINLVVAKYNSSGICLWAVTAGDINDDIGYSISTDSFGSSYVTGYINGNCFFGTTYVSGVQGQDIFVAKYSTTGNLVWVTKIGGIFYDRGKAVLKDVGGYCHVAGDFTEQATFGTTTLVADPGISATFITRIGGGTVGIDEQIENAPFNLYPNPASDAVTVSFNNIKDAVFTADILNVEGKLMKSFTLNQDDAVAGYEIKLTGLSSGNYILRVNTSDGDFTRRLVVKE